MTMVDNRVFKLVGHRGFPEKFPENSLAGMLAALQNGANALEFDVQLSKDGELVVIHDENLKRVAGIDLSVAETPFRNLAQLSVHEPSRFEKHFEPTPIMSLLQFCTGIFQSTEFANYCTLNDSAPSIFVEIKASIFKRISYQSCIEKLVPAIASLKSHCVIISFDLDFLREVQARLNLPVGWVLKEYSDKSLKLVQGQLVDFLICDYKKIPVSGRLWPGSWQWFVYDIVSQKDLLRCLDMGVSWIETWNVEAMSVIAAQMKKGEPMLGSQD